MTLAVGGRLGSYEIVSPLGVGGMGEVYRARDSKLNRDVALKVLPDAFIADPDRLARFKREAQLLASLNHPNIGAIYGFEDSDGAQALVLELVDGPTLADRIAQGPLPLDEAIPIAKQIAEALEAAHEQGIIHRDLKPANIKLRPDGSVKVLDFGLAKALAQGSGIGGQGSGSLANSPTITSPAMTQAGMILGTAAYMAPEQAKGREADKRSDVWAFGAVLYEMLTGMRPFEGEDVADTLASVLKGEPDWSRIPNAVPSLITDAIRGCLKRDRRQRIADASTVRFALDSAATQSQTRYGDAAAVDVTRSIADALAGERRRARRRHVLPLAGLCAALAVAALVAWLRPTSAPTTVSRFVLNLSTSYALPITGRKALAVSDDGQQIAYVGTGGLELRRVSEFESRTIVAGTGLNSPEFSPDGRTLVFHELRSSSQGGPVIRRVSTTGGTAVDLCQCPPPYGTTWDGNGVLVGVGRQGVVRCNLGGGATQKVLDAVDGEEVHGPQMLPDGVHLLFTVAKVSDGDNRWERANIVVESLSTHERTVVIEGGSDGRLLSSGHLVFAREGVVFAVPFDTHTNRVVGDPTSVVEGITRPAAGTTGAAQFAVSTSGTLVYYPGPTRTIAAGRLLAIATRDGVVTRLPVERGRYVHTRISPDGKQVAVGSDEGAQSSIWIYELGSNSPMRRLVLKGRNEFPIWTPTGKQLAFSSDGQGDRGIFLQSADGTGVVERLTTAAADETHIPEAWSPNGQHLMFAVRKAGTYALRVLDSTTRRVEPVAGIESSEPLGAVFSPDGKWLAFTRAGTELAPMTRGVYVQRFPSGESYQAPKQALDFHPSWNPRGMELIYVASVATGRLVIVPVQTTPNFQFGKPTIVTATVMGARVAGQTRAYDVMPDGRFIGVVNADEPETAPRIELRVVLNWLEELKQNVPMPK